jgi:hypothetical protein
MHGTNDPLTGPYKEPRGTIKVFHPPRNRFSPGSSHWKKRHQILHYCSLEGVGIYPFRHNIALVYAVHILRFKHLECQRKKKVLFCVMLPDFRKSVPFWKVLKLRPFIFLVRTTCRWGVYGVLVEWCWQGYTEVLGEKPVPVPNPSK